MSAAHHLPTPEEALDDWARGVLPLKDIERRLAIADKINALAGILDDPTAECEAALARVGGNGSKPAGTSVRHQAEVEPPPVAGFNLTDLGNAERFAARHAESVRAVRGHGLLAYDPRRGIYVDEHAQLVRYAKDTVRAIYGEAEQCADESGRKAIAKHAERSEAKRALDAMLALAESEEALEAEVKDFDSDPDRLCATNGVVDLATGELAEHSPAWRMTKTAGAAYRPGAPCPVWQAHLSRIFAADATLIAFVQRLFGYAATGRTGEQVFVIFHGDGANGKSATLKAVQDALGDYATVASFATFTPHRTDAIRNDLAALAGARLVTTSENRVRQALDEAVIKQLTGGDDITARFLHHEPFTFTPAFLIVLSTNYRPKIECPDFALKRRVLLVPFDVRIPEAEQDKRLGEKLDTELDGILTWAIEGATQYLAHGLDIPERVRAATEAYRDEMDPLYAFREYITLDPAAWTAAADIRRALETWAHDEGVKTLPDNRELTTWLKSLGCTPGRLHKGRGWYGIRCEGADSAQSFDEGA